MLVPGALFVGFVRKVLIPLVEGALISGCAAPVLSLRGMLSIPVATAVLVAAVIGWLALRLCC
jgi:hypothetical protein